MNEYRIFIKSSFSPVAYSLPEVKPVMSQTELAAVEMITISQGIEISSAKQSINTLLEERPLELKKEGEGKTRMITH